MLPKSCHQIDKVAQVSVHKGAIKKVAKGLVNRETKLEEERQKLDRLINSRIGSALKIVEAKSHKSKA
ncbi:hypothetical protein MJO28_005930 [Puccinia striiformis f. sp. tritici]|uniref:Uncharacterized protein n=1 Tax=Puccinia striiformis f. sp. tritici TaxID=168172 RepID=A0ACC0EHT6_9BASI|nr:hypothetical protein MJO28_005930 [Puccinia striiformis f. sp. tritici]